MAFSDNAIEYMRRKKAGMFAIVDNLSRDAEGNMRMDAPWKDRTTTARRALHSGVEPGQGEKIIMYLAHGVQYGRHLEEGTPPHVITPKNKKALRWKGPDGYIFARRVRHPGTQPRAIVQPTAEKYKDKLRDAALKWWGVE